MTPTVFTIGHSVHDAEVFKNFLTTYGIEVLIDVRSRPYSRFSPQFNKETLESLIAGDIQYIHLESLGGRPADRSMYDSSGHVLYGKVADSEVFITGLAELEVRARTSNTAFMCSEEDPSDCHRRLLVGQVLKERGWRVRHIRGDGSLMDEAELADTVGRVEDGLFGGDFSTWRSIRSVLPNDQQNPSSRR